MRTEQKNIIATGLVLAASIALYFGWREFWFLTDDAFIAFRYVNNSIQGHGYVWNPEPFRPVEGYTSFLQLLILEAVWRLFGKEPPASSNYISLVFSFGSLLITSIAVMKMRLRHYLERIRLVLLPIVIIGLLTNVSFLTWSSSGLETAMFNFFFLAWILAVMKVGQRRNLWLFTITFLASLVYLTRPDGILVVVGTLIIICYYFTIEIRANRFEYKSLAFALPILVTPIHIIWRKSFYGEWLPNTYYAKYVEAWPEAGIRYLISYIIEYGVWVWLILSGIVIIILLRQIKTDVGLKRKLRELTARIGHERSNGICAFVAVSCLVAQVGFYTFFVGGDHFEWRVYSHLPPLLLLSAIYFLNAMNISSIRSIVVLSIVVVVSTPIPWTYHFAEKKISQVNKEETLFIAVSEKLPVFFRPLTDLQDYLQTWLTSHLICVRWREHQLFYESMTASFNMRSFEIPENAGQFPVAVTSTVGVAGWVLPDVAIIDAYGLNDYIIARHRDQINPERKMAHDRTPPDNYINSYVPNVMLVEGGKALYRKRPAQYELTAEKIRALDNYWEAKIVRGEPVPDTLATIPIIPE